MVKETRITVGPEDVKVCGLQCTQCSAEIMLSVNAKWPFPGECPICSAPWRHKQDVEKAKNFIELLRDLRRETESPVQVRLVFNGEDA